MDTGEGVAFVNNGQLRNNNKDHIKCFNYGVMVESVFQVIVLFGYR